jgi:hypothetical protein
MQVHDAGVIHTKKELSRKTRGDGQWWRTNCKPTDSYTKATACMLPRSWVFLHERQPKRSPALRERSQPPTQLSSKLYCCVLPPPREHVLRLPCIDLLRAPPRGKIYTHISTRGTANSDGVCLNATAARASCGQWEAVRNRVTAWTRPADLEWHVPVGDVSNPLFKRPRQNAILGEFVRWRHAILSDEQAPLRAASK